MIHLIDNLPPETIAMLQALYSRSPKSVHEHLGSMRDPSRFMSDYYIGYGHKSIGDCGSTTIFIEGVSMLCAKAIQDWPLYSGQEASTRYMDMSKAVFLGGAERLRSLYMKVYSRMVDAYMDRGQSIKAARAAAFDVARGYLPAGCATNLSWHGNLRQISDHLSGLRCHPLDEVRRVAAEITGVLQSAYPSSFVSRERPEADAWMAAQVSHLTYAHKPCARVVDTSGLALNDSILSFINQRPVRGELHHRFRGLGQIMFTFPIDFGSYRDFQRHRSCCQNMPLLTLECFEPWYMDQLPSDIRGSVVDELSSYINGLGTLSTTTGLDVHNLQYLVPMGYRVYVYATMSLPSAIYIAELRSSASVHPTLRSIAHWMCDCLSSTGLSIYKDTSTLGEQRSSQDIIAK